MKIKQDTLLGNVINAVITVVVASIAAPLLSELGKLLKGLATQPGLLQSVADFFVALGSALSFGSSAWIAVLAALGAGALMIGLIKRARAKPHKDDDHAIVVHEPLSPRAPPVSPPSPPPPNPKDWSGAIGELKSLQIRIERILNDEQATDDQKDAFFGKQRPHNEASFLTIRKAGLHLPVVEKFDRIDMENVNKVIGEVLPFLDQQHFDEAIERSREKSLGAQISIETTRAFMGSAELMSALALFMRK